MIVFVVVLKILSEKLPAAKKSYQVSKWLVLAFSLANLVVLLVSIFGRRKFGLCKKNYPNSLGGLALKGLLILFDISIFVWRCFNWGVKQQDENDMADSKEHNFFK
jgi:hypothetical protein